MRTTANRWLLLILIAFIIQISANTSDYKLIFEDKHYLTEGILQILATDLDNNQTDEVILVGKNYIDQEVFLYWLSFDSENKPFIQWQSENLYEDRSIIWAVTGKFTSEKNQLLAISNSQYYLYQFENNHVNLLKQEKHNFPTLHIPSKEFDGKIINVASGDVDGDGQTEIIVARVGKITAKIYNGMVQIWKFRKGMLELVTESDLVGNIRGITVGDLDQDGQAEIFVEEGPKFAPGNMYILKYNDQKLTETYCLKKATKGPAYGMQVKTFPGGNRLVIATATGYIDFFTWEKDTLVLVEKELNLDRDLMSIAAININNDQEPELIVASYPQEFTILTKGKNELERTK